MRRPTLLLASLATLAVAALAWQLQRDPASTLQVGNSADGANAPVRAHSDVTQRGIDAPPREEVEGLRTPDSRATTNEPRLRVRLRGVRPEAPWTEPVILSVFDFGESAELSFHATCTPDIDGRIVFSLPDWCAPDSSGRRVHRAWLSAADPNYEPIGWSNRSLDLSRELEFDVELVGVLTGNVRNAAGAPVAASRVVALALRNGQPLPGVIATAPAERDGSYRLLVPPDSPVMLVALSCGRSVTGGSSGVRTYWWMTKDLLPATKVATAILGAPTIVPDFVLEPAAQVAGTVQWDDGTPISLVVVEGLPRDGDTLPLAGSDFLRRTADGRLAPGMAIMTNANGAFVLPALPGATIDVQLAEVGNQDVTLLAPLPRQSVSAAMAVVFTLPRPVVLRARLAEEPIASADIEVADQCTLRTGPSGQLAVVPVAPVRVRACQSNLRSTWNEIGPTDAGRTIDLALQPTTPTPVTVEVDDAPTPAIHTIRYRRDGGLEYRDSVAGGDKLELFLDPGNYHFAVVVRDSNRLMIEDDVDIHVDTKPVAVRLRSSPGGTFAVKATDGHGAWVRGTCTVRDTAGHEWRGCFLGQDNTEWRGCFQGQGSPEGRPGELLATGVNTFLRRLPPGDYELHCDFGARGQHREVVTIRANETTDVRIRLP